MEEIHVYHSIWKSAFDIVVDAACIALGIHALRMGIKPTFVCWFAIVSFTLFGLTVIYTILRERFGHRPYLVITDEAVILDSGKNREIRFDEVESFKLAWVPFGRIIGVKFLNERAQDVVFAGDVTMKWKDLINVLNERLAAVKKA